MLIQAVTCVIYTTGMGLFSLPAFSAEQGEVTERGAETRDHRTLAPPPLAPPGIQQGSNNPLGYRVVFLDTEPDNFTLANPIKKFLVFIDCQAEYERCPQRTGISVEIWHTKPGGQPVLAGTVRNQTLDGQRPYVLDGKSTLTFHPLRILGGVAGSPDGFFTVKLLSGQSVLSQRVFPVLPSQWKIQNPTPPPVVDHRSNR
jgi:hypothetical protein